MFVESEDRAMSRVVGGVVSLIVLFTAVPSRALFHLAVIDEVMARLGSDTTTQYVEIRMLSANQNLVAHSRLTAFNCNGSTHTVLLEVPSNVTNQGAGVRWIMAHKSPIGGITPDLTWTTGTIPTDCGMVCWGAPGI